MNSNASVEILNPALDASRATIAIFDFDGTLSLIRSGWVDVMVPQMVETLLELNTGESEADLTPIVREFVDRLTGKQTIYQMIELARQIEIRGGSPKDPLVYKHAYLDRLNSRIADRLEGLRSGKAAPTDYLVPGSFELLHMLRARGIRLILASGTDEPLVLEEARLLQLDGLFENRIYGALDDYKSFSKKILIERLLRETGLPGANILGFGDGYVEIQNVKEVGGTAIGVASDEPACLKVDTWKRDRLANVGADAIIPNFLCTPELEQALFHA